MVAAHPGVYRRGRSRFIHLSFRLFFIQFVKRFSIRFKGCWRAFLRLPAYRRGLPLHFLFKAGECAGKRLETGTKKPHPAKDRAGESERLKR